MTPIQKAIASKKAARARLFPNFVVHDIVWARHLAEMRMLLDRAQRTNVCWNCRRRWTPTPEMWAAQRLVCTYCGAVHEPLFK